MAEQDALAGFDFNKFSGSGLFLKFEAGRPVTLRVLTVDPVVVQKEFTDKQTGELNLNTQFWFIVYNFTDKAAQIMRASPGVAKRIGQLHNDEDFGANIKNADIKISPTGEGLERRYEIQVIRHSGNQTTLTAEQVKEAQAINLDKQAENDKGIRMSKWEEQQKMKPANVGDIHVGKDDYPIADMGDEPINLDDIPF